MLFLTVGTTQNFAGNTSTQAERTAEIECVVDMLGIDEWDIAFPGDEYHLRLDQLAQKDIIHAIERGEKISLEATKPDMLVFPTVGDYNQDHRAAAEAVFTACRPSPRYDKFVPDLVMSYETPMDWWSHPGTHDQPNFFIEVTEKEVNKKIEALACYKSQARRKGHPRNGLALHALAQLRGACTGKAFAEGFYCHTLTT